MTSHNSSAQIYVGTSASPLSFIDETSNSVSGKQNNFSIKSGYVYMFSKKFGVGSGFEFSQYSQNVNAFGNVNSSSNLIDDTNSAFEYRTSAEGYSEKQKLSALQIPLFLQFKTLININTNFYTRIGVKYLLPIQFEAKGKASQITAEGYYPDFNLLISDLPSRGFGNSNNYTATSEYETENVILASAEIGFSFKVAKKGALYAGFYLDHATQSIIKNPESKAIIGYNSNTIANRTLNGLYATDSNTKVLPVSFGLTIMYSFE